MMTTKLFSPKTLPYDLTAGMVVFLVAMPLCLGLGLASGAKPISGLLAGVIGGIVVGFFSRSHLSVSGPAAGLVAVVATQISALGTFPTFLLAVVIAGLVQIALGFLRAGAIAAFIPSSVVRGLLAAIGVLLILKQLPHLFGRDEDYVGEMAFFQVNQENTFTEILNIYGHVNPGVAAIGLLSVAILVVWERWKPLKTSFVPAVLVVVLLGVGLSFVFRQLGGHWTMAASHFVKVPVAKNVTELMSFLQFPDFSQWANSQVYFAGLTIAAVASLEALFSIEAIDKLDPRQRTTSPNRELIAQGLGNTVCGLIGGLPITAVIARSTVNLESNARTKLAAIFQGVLMAVCVVALPVVINMIPLSCLAAILIVTGAKLISPAVVRQMWQAGKYQFIPFVVTILAIVFTDLLVGLLIGLVVSACFILNSNLRRPMRQIREKYVGGEVLRIELGAASQLPQPRVATKSA